MLLARFRLHVRSQVDSRGAVEARIAHIEATDHDYEAACEWARIAQERARGIGDNHLVAQALRTEAQALLRMGEHRGAIAALLSVLPRSPRTRLAQSRALQPSRWSLRRPTRLPGRRASRRQGPVPGRGRRTTQRTFCSALNLSGSILMEVGDTPVPSESSTGPSRWLDRSALPRLRPLRSPTRGMVAYIEGKPGSAARHMEEAAERLGNVGRRSAEARTRGNLGQVLIDMLGAVERGAEQGHRELAAARGDRGQTREEPSLRCAGSSSSCRWRSSRGSHPIRKLRRDRSRCWVPGYRGSGLAATGGRSHR